MGRGIRMTSAHVLALGEDRRVENLSGNEGPLRCDDCRTPVEYVRKHSRRNDDPKLAREVNAYIRLTKGSDHSDGCRYTPLGQVLRLVHDSEAVENTLNPFRALSQHEFEFRLNIATDAIGTLKRGNGEPTSEEKAERQALTERVWSGQSISPYCRSATGLARLFRMMEDAVAAGELEQRVKIAHNGKLIPWREFFFELRGDRYASLANKLEKQELNHPVAVLVYITGVNAPAEGRRPSLKCWWERSNRQSANRIAPTIYGHLDLLKKMEVGQHYIVFGQWWHMSDNNSAHGKSTYRNIAVKIYQAAQFSLVESPENYPDDDR